MTSQSIAAQHSRRRVKPVQTAASDDTARLSATVARSGSQLAGREPGGANSHSYNGVT
jgi:hypothetical protein